MKAFHQYVLIGMLFAFASCKPGGGGGGGDDGGPIDPVPSDDAGDDSVDGQPEPTDDGRDDGSVDGTDTDTGTDDGTVDGEPDEPDQPTITCDGQAPGTERDLACADGYIGKRHQICLASGRWFESSNTCAKKPEPLPPLKVELPFAYRIKKGDAVTIGVRDQTGVTFAWSSGAQGAEATVTPDRDRIYTVTAARAADGAKASASLTVITTTPSQRGESK